MSYYLGLEIVSGNDTQNVNWRHGPNKPYAVIWVDPEHKFSTNVDEEGDTCPKWYDNSFILPFTWDNNQDRNINVYFDVEHEGSEENTKPFIGSAHLNLVDLIDEAGFDNRVKKTLKLLRPSGRPQGELYITLFVQKPRQPDDGSDSRTHRG